MQLIFRLFLGGLLFGIVRKFLLPTFDIVQPMVDPRQVFLELLQGGRQFRFQSHEAMCVRVDLRPWMRIVGALEDAIQRVIVRVRNGIEFVIVAAGATDTQTQNPSA